MAGRVAGKVAFVTGAARGQGRSHAVRLAEEGADIIAIDSCGGVDTACYELPTAAELEETAELVRQHGARVLMAQVDVRDSQAMDSLLSRGVQELGSLDIVCANAGIMSFGRADELTDLEWQETIDVNLTGVWRTTRAAIPHLRRSGKGGSIILTSSTAGVKGVPNLSHYTAAKHGVVGFMRSVAQELAPDRIRVNCVHPTAVSTPLMLNDAVYAKFRPDLESPTLEDAREGFVGLNLLPVPWIEEVDVSNAVLFLASDEARYITASTLMVDAGATQK
ncbi:(-)-trans-carveol dehydrogenase [metagenome]|uniref:(-)-trans-carveol dehydrogenase n=1 Tax=metagenome TaxID=256318 RepID=A0A2P2C447_9ZZZZ